MSPYGINSIFTYDLIRKAFGILSDLVYSSLSITIITYISILPF